MVKIGTVVKIVKNRDRRIISSYEEDHVELAEKVKRLHEPGCYVLLTNSNHPMVYELGSPVKVVVNCIRFVAL